MTRLFIFGYIRKKCCMKRTAGIFTASSLNASPLSIRFWKIVQLLFWCVGIGLMLTMLFVPALGVTLFWNILIPLAPALLVMCTGIWRNICPLATTSLIPEKLGISKKKKLSFDQQQTLNIFGVTALFIIIPLRHVLFDISGQATATIIFAISVVAVSAGIIFESKSGWCAGLCPIHAVEKLYGSKVAFSLPNAHCNTCVKCSVPCPDSTKNLTPLSLKSSKSKVVEILLAGAFPGYIWGWFQVPDYMPGFPLKDYFSVYTFPLLGGIVTLLSYLAAKRLLKKNSKLVIRLFAAAAVSCYYWFRLPQLFGFSNVATNGVLIDLNGHLSIWSIYIVRLTTTFLFMWWMVFANVKEKSWTVRPAYAVE